MFALNRRHHEVRGRDGRQGIAAASSAALILNRDSSMSASATRRASTRLSRATKMRRRALSTSAESRRAKGEKIGSSTSSVDMVSFLLRQLGELLGQVVANSGVVELVDEAAHCMLGNLGVGDEKLPPGHGRLQGLDARQADIGLLAGRDDVVLLDERLVARPRLVDLVLVFELRSRLLGLGQLPLLVPVGMHLEDRAQREGVDGGAEDSDELEGGVVDGRGSEAALGADAGEGDREQKVDEDAQHLQEPMQPAAGRDRGSDRKRDSDDGERLRHVDRHPPRLGRWIESTRVQSRSNDNSFHRKREHVGRSADGEGAKDKAAGHDEQVPKPGQSLEALGGGAPGPVVGVSGRLGGVGETNAEMIKHAQVGALKLVGDAAFLERKRGASFDLRDGVGLDLPGELR